MTKILVVDDSISVRKALERILVPKGLEVQSAESAEVALVRLEHDRPDLVIADVVMPDKSGFELCQILKRGRFSDIPVILISGIVDNSVIQKAKDVGAESVIRKPFMADDLFSKIEAAFGTPLSVLAAPKPAAANAAPMMALAAPGFAAAALGSQALGSQALATQSASINMPPPVISHIPASNLPNAQTPPMVTPAPVSLSASLGGSQDGSTRNANSFDALLQPLLEKPEVNTAILMTVRGEPLALLGKSVPDPVAFGTFCRTLLSVAGGVGGHLQFVGLQTLSLEYKNHNVFLTAVSERIVLILLNATSSTPATVRYMVSRQVPLLRDALQRLN